MADSNHSPKIGQLDLNLHHLLYLKFCDFQRKFKNSWRPATPSLFGFVGSNSPSIDSQCLRIFGKHFGESPHLSSVVLSMAVQSSAAPPPGLREARVASCGSPAPWRPRGTFLPPGRSSFRERSPGGASDKLLLVPRAFPRAGRGASQHFMGVLFKGQDAEKGLRGGCCRWW